MSRYGYGPKPIYGTESYSRSNRPGATPDRIARAITLVRTSTTHTIASRRSRELVPVLWGTLGRVQGSRFMFFCTSSAQCMGVEKQSKAGEHLETGCSALWLHVRGLSDFRAGNTTANAPRYTKFQCKAQFVWSEKNNNGHASQRVCLKSAVSYLSHMTAAGHCYKPGARTAAHRHLRRVGASRCPAATGGILDTTRRFSGRSAERT